MHSRLIGFAKMVAAAAVAFAAVAHADTWKDTVTGLTWTYTTDGDEATIANWVEDGYFYTRAVDPQPEGAIAIPATLGGKTVTAIGSKALLGCGGLTGVTIPASVKGIGSEAFSECANLETVSMPGVDSIGAKAFNGCAKLSSIAMPGEAEVYGEKAFAGCEGLADGNGLIIIGGVLYGAGENLQPHVVVPDTVVRIAGHAFENEWGVTGLTIPGSVKNIGEYAFNCCSLADGLVIQDGVESIGAAAFFGCTGLKSVAIPGSVANIGESAFNGSDGLASVTIVDGADKTLETSAFNCLGLQSVALPPSVKTIGPAAIFPNVKTIYVGSGDTARMKGLLGAIDGSADFVEPSGAYVVTLDPEGGICGAASVMVKKGAAAGTLPDALFSGKSFDGWYTSASGGTKITAETAVTGNVTYYAHWTEEGRPPANDMFANATAISGASGSVAGSNVNATFETGEPLYAGSWKSETTVWWKWTAPADGTATFDTKGSSPDTVMGAYTGNAVASLARVEENDDSPDGGNTSKISFGAVKGTTYRIAVGSYGNATGGSLTLNWSLVAEATTYTVTFDKNGGDSVSESSRQVEEGMAVGVPLPTAARSGWSLVGWFTDPSGGRQIYGSEEVVADVTYYAHWQQSTVELLKTVVDGIEWSYFVGAGGKITLYNNGVSILPADFKGQMAIPAKIGGKTVSGIGGRAFYGSAGLTVVTIPDSVTDIYDEAFAECGNLEVVQFGKGIAKNGSIFNKAFAGCAKLKALDFKGTTPAHAAEYAFEGAGVSTGLGRPAVYVAKASAKAWGNAWAGMDVFPYSYYAWIEVRVRPGKEEYGSVTPVESGAKTEIGKKVTLKATVKTLTSGKTKSKCAFAGWYDRATGECVSLAPSFSYTVTGEDRQFEADFATEQDDADSLAIAAVDAATASDGTLPAPIDVGAMVTSLSEPKVTLKGLPAGLKFDAKTLSVTGKATKPGVYTVTISATNASQKKAKSADFTITVPNFVDALIGVADSYGPFVPGAEYAQQIPGAADCAVAGLPSGMKWTAKDVVDSKTKFVMVPANSFYGAPTKPGNYTVTFTKTVKELDAKGKQVSVKHTATSTFVVGPFPKLTIETVGASGKDKVAGAGEYAANKKVSLKAAPDGTKGAVKVFMGWYDAWDNLISRAASYSYAMPEADTVLKAKFITAEEDAAHVTASLSGIGDFDQGNVEESVDLHCGVYEEWPLAVYAWSQTTVKVTGLPSGLKFTAKDIVDSKTKKVTVPANTIYGTPTAPSKTDRVTGDYVPYDIKITITTSGKTVVDYTVKAMVYPVPAGMSGTFDGGGDAGQATLTVAAAGKISGKYLSGGLVWTLSAPYFDSYAESPDTYDATVEAKCGKDTATLALRIQRGAAGAEATLWDDGGSEIARLGLNNWKGGPYAPVAKLFPKAKEIVLDVEDDAGVPGTLSLKFASAGTVAGKGDFTTGTDARGRDVKHQPSFSAPLVATSFPYRISPDTEEIGFTAKAYIYLPPDAKKGFAGLVKIVEFEFDGKDFILK